MTMTAMVLAMGTGAAPGGNPLSGPLPLMLIVFAIFYFMLIRPQQRKEKARRKMIEEVKSGDRVLFSGGILGTVANVKDQLLVVKVADNVKLEIARGAVNRVLEKDEKVVAEQA